MTAQILIYKPLKQQKTKKQITIIAKPLIKYVSFCHNINKITNRLLISNKHIRRAC